MRRNDGGPAFPRIDGINNAGALTDVIVTDGMTLRDYFASAALQALISSPQSVNSLVDYLVKNKPEASREEVKEHVAASAYALADAMIIIREKTKEI